MKFLLILTIFSSFLFSSCHTESDQNVNADVSFNLLDADQTGVSFSNKVDDTEKFNILTYRNYYNGGGVAIGDINNDGLQDIFFTANMSSNKLYLNKGEMQFEDITDKTKLSGKSSWTTGVTMADVNADGWLDIYVCYSGNVLEENKENELFINNGDLTFTESAKEYGLNDFGSSTQAAFFDYDLDGDLDCYILNNSYVDPERLSSYARVRYEYGAKGGDRLYINENGHFRDFTKESGIYSSDIGFGLGISVGDINNDLYPDLYISNDFWERDYLYINQKDGTYKEELTERVSYISLASMGSDIADVNNDGNLDLFTTDMLPPDNYRLKAATNYDEFYQHNRQLRDNHYYQYVQNCLQINNGDAEFTETAQFSGVSATDWSWGALIFDMNLDGQKDLFVSNGLFHDITDMDFIDFIADKSEVQKIVEESGKYDFRDFVKLLPPNERMNYAFINQGGLKFENLATEMKMDQGGFSNGSAYGDLDNDGDFDLVVNNVNMPAFIYQSDAANSGKKFLKIKLKGTESNTKGIGTTVKAYANGEEQILQSFSSRGFQSSVDSDLIFGFGTTEKIDSLRVIWPDFKTELITRPVVNSTLTLEYSKANSTYVLQVQHQQKTFSQVENADFYTNKHIENNFIDFDTQNLMPHMLSNEGPEMVVGDVNGDGKNDVIMGGAAGFPDQLFINNGNSFKKLDQPDFVANSKSETVCGALFDADGDGDLDYLAGMGGNQASLGLEGYKVIYYENTGKGVFKRNDLKAPSAAGFVGCIKPADIDNDGDLDLFIGGRAIPAAYGMTPRSFVFMNEGAGQWKDVTTQFTGPLGMVTDAVWSDVNGDNYKDLIVVGEWMPIAVLINDRGSLTEPKVIPSSEGWWNTIEMADIDQDGDMDYLLGNWGENIKFPASQKRPLTAYISDFDHNSRPDVILEWYGKEDQKAFPFASKKDLTAEMPLLKKSLLKYHDYANKQVADIFDSETLEKALKKQVTNFSSSILRNDNGNLILEPLSFENQLSPIFSFVIADFDKDGITDYAVGGNYYNLKPEVGRHDGFRGGYFKGLGKGKFKFITAHESGLRIYGEVRSMKIIDNKILVGRNNDAILVFE